MLARDAVWGGSTLRKTATKPAENDSPNTTISPFVIKNIPGVDQLEEIKQIYVTKAPQISRDKEAWQSKSRSLQLAVR
jgi:hypothetical protein